MAACERWARDGGIDAPPGYFPRSFGLRNDAILGELIPGRTPAEYEQLAADKETLFRQLARGRLEALPGVRALLDALDENSARKAVVTSTPRVNLDFIIDDLGITCRFDTLVSAEDTAHGKPDPEGFLLAAARVGVEPARCTVVEDAPHGLQAAAAAGIRAIGVTTSHAAAELAAADLVVDSLEDPRVLDFVLSPGRP